MSRSRTIATWYADANDVEHDITVEVSALDIRTAEVETDLPDMPAGEERCLRERASELYWAAEREAYLRSPQAERDGA